MVDREVKRVPWWALLSSALAPVLLIGGWTLAAARQPAGYSSVTQTISSLAALGATDRWLMTAALTGVGLAHLVTALGLRPAATAGRLVLAVGGIATLLVAAFPLPRVGGSGRHTLAAAVAFGALALWPALAWRARSPAAALRPTVSIVAAAVLLGLVIWFAAELHSGTRVGLAERVAAGAQAGWPLVAVLSVVVSARRGGGRPT